MPEKQSPEIKSTMKDPDHAKGGVEQDRPGQPTNTDFLVEQNEHRHKVDASPDTDTDFPEPGNTPEYSMQKQDDPKKQGDKILHQKNDPDGNAPVSEEVDQDPGERQKENQNDKKNDDLAA